MPAKKTHGMTNTPTYRSWNSMISRCVRRYDDKRKQKYYGSINVCKRWLKFENFLFDMGIRPDGTTLDRINTKEDYTPRNCKWSTRSRQNINSEMKNKKTSKYKGVSWHKGHGNWSAQISINGKDMWIGSFLSEKKAFDAYKTIFKEWHGHDPLYT